jgi:hypothetical protein
MVLVWFIGTCEVLCGLEWLVAVDVAMFSRWWG